jgi:hypothetical protein
MSASSDRKEIERARRAAGRELEAVLTAAVAEIGFIRRGGLYHCPLGSGVSGWLALQIKRELDSFSVFGNVGVRWEELHRVINELEGRKPGTEPTLTIMLGYLMPQNSANVAWEFDRLDDPLWAPRAENLAQHVMEYGLPWMRQFATPQDVFGGLDKHGHHFRPEREAVGALLLGDPQHALTITREHLAAITHRADPAACNYRAFAAALEARIASQAGVRDDSLDSDA